jgi:hypothetical protein
MIITKILGLALLSFPLWYAFDAITKDNVKALLLTLAILAGLQLYV